MAVLQAKLLERKRQEEQAPVSPLDLAARLGLWLMLPTVFGTPELFRPMVDLYIRRWEEHGRDPADRRIGCCAHAWVAPEEATARREWEPRYRAYVEWVNELFRVSSGLADGQGLGTFDFEERLRTIAICGTPAQAIDRIRSISEVLSLDTSPMGGINQATMVVKGDSVWTKLRFEGGPHRVQRVPVTESQGRIHTSSATVLVLPEAEEVDVQIDEKDLPLPAGYGFSRGGIEASRVCLHNLRELLPAA